MIIVRSTSVLPRLVLVSVSSSACKICATQHQQRRAFGIISSLAFHNTPQRSFTVDDLDRVRDSRQRVVILGSGWAGYTVARRLDPRKYQAVIVSPRSYFVFTPLLASCSVGTLEFRTALEPVRSKRTSSVFFQGWADEVDFENKTLSIEEAVDDPRQGLALTVDPYNRKSLDERTKEKATEVKKGQIFSLKYDKLVMAVGCYSQTFNTPGVREHALFLKDIGDARKIRNRILRCFEAASLPTTTEEMKKILLNFAIVGGGPTGIEFAAELHDIVSDDLVKLYPSLKSYFNITIYDVAPKVLSMFDEKLGKYAMKHFAREGINIRTSHHVESLRRGPPSTMSQEALEDDHVCWTLKLKEEGEIGVGMVVWSTGLMMNPFVEHALGKPQKLLIPHAKSIQYSDSGPSASKWLVRKHTKSGAIITDDALRVTMESADEPSPPASQTPDPRDDASSQKSSMVLQDVFAIGDCATQEGVMYPATAQVANQKAEWLAKHLNRGDVAESKFTWKDMGVMAYMGNWNAIVQTKGPKISGRTAFLIWRGAYLTKSVSWRNKILIPMYWFLNWVFGRDISRF